jgi:RecA-family ATPase
METLVDTRYKTLLAEEKAKSKLAAENFSGSTELSLDDLQSTVNEFIVEDLIPVQSIGFIVARSNIGKTFAYVDLACRAIFEKPWLGKKTKRIKVLIVLGEGKAGFYQRLAAWMNFHNQDIEALRTSMFWIDGANLFSDASIEKIAEVANREQVDLIIMDTWAATSGVMDENAGALNSMALNRAVQIRPEAAYLFIHHPTKTTQNSECPEMRGSGALKGRADYVMALYDDESFNSSSGEKQAWIALSTEFHHGGKNRNAKTETLRGLYLADTEDDQKVFLQVESEAISKRSLLVRSELFGQMTVDEFAKKIGKSDSTARRALNAAVSEGIAILHQRQSASSPDRYELSETAKQANTLTWPRPQDITSTSNFKF